VPPLKRDVNELIDASKHPFHEHAVVELFLARRGNEIVGRIAAIHNDLHLEVHGDRTGFFGLFETVDDRDVAFALFDAAAAWLRKRGLETMRGPASFSLNEEAGLLVDGFEGPPVVMMTYNPRWYVDLVESYGFSKAKDLLAYWFGHVEPPERFVRLAGQLKQRYKVTLRTLDKTRFADEVAAVRKIYNEAWEKNWGHIPMTEAELDYMAKQLKPVVDPAIVVFAYVDGDLAGFGLGLPDLNIALRKMNGSLFPFGWAKALWYSRKIRIARVLTLGVLTKYRRAGVAELIELEMIRNAMKRGITGAEFSWILEDNHLMRTNLERMGAVVYRTYRMYDIPIGAGDGA
jgi:GNAT superfamily N-acetyltransferase